MNLYLFPSSAGESDLPQALVHKILELDGSMPCKESFHVPLHPYCLFSVDIEIAIQPSLGNLLDIGVAKTRQAA
jgi:hypothetical protein